MAKHRIAKKPKSNAGSSIPWWGVAAIGAGLIIVPVPGSDLLGVSILVSLAGYTALSGGK